MLPPRVTAAAFASEIEGAHEWARRAHVKLEAVLPQQLVRAVFVREASGEEFFLQGRFDGYKEMPPAWEWCDSDWSDPDNRRLSPEAAPTPYGSSMFLAQGDKAVICAPFNRLAFKANGGPHDNWGELSHWMTAGDEYVYAVTIGDMLNSVERDFRYTTGRMG